MISEISPDIGYLDLTPVFKSAVARRIPVFIPDDTHWSSQGHLVVAEALIGTLTEGRNPDAENQSPAIQNMENMLLANNAIMIRNVDGTIRYWSKGAKQLYGWDPKDVLGTTSHQLLQTVFPVPLKVIEEELRLKGHWHGHLIHKRRDGSTIIVSSHWDLQQNPTSNDQSITVIEVNGRSDS
jgi:PAS domain S-box-containing protein